MKFTLLKRGFKQLLLLFLCTPMFLMASQKQLPEEVEVQINNYKVNAIKNRNLGNDNAASSYLNKIAFLYWEYFIYDEAVSYFTQVLKVTQDIGNKSGEQKVLENLALVYADMERYDKAIECYNKSLALIGEKNDKTAMATGMSNLAIAYLSNGNYNEAIETATQGLELSKELNHIKLMRSYYGILHESYDKLGNSEKSTEFFALYSSMDKHVQQQIFQEKEKLNKEKIQQIETEKAQVVEEKKQTEQVLIQTQDTLVEVEQVSKERELQINLLNVEAELRENKLQAERRMKNQAVVSLLIVLFLAILAFIQMKAKKKANKKLRKLNTEIQKKNKHILDSINYAKHIQEAILPFREKLLKSLPESFVFYKPRDIVSGDFYWHQTHGDKIFIAAIDCTGHGVPGAFMSMIGNTLLNEIVNERQVFNPAEVLKLLNEKVVSTLKQDVEDEGLSEDGMDLSFCCIDKKQKTIELALANHTATVVKNGVLNTIEGDVFSVGGNVFSVEDVNFTNHKIDIDGETSVYLYSDGFQDQFGGENNQKYMVGKFNNFLSSMQGNGFIDQETQIESEFYDWKGLTKQVDDILVIGFRVS